MTTLNNWGPTAVILIGILSLYFQNRGFDKRLDDLRHQMNTRFDDLYRYLDVRFTEVERRLTALESHTTETR